MSTTKESIKDAVSENHVAPRPNILLIMVDQMRYPRFGYGPGSGFSDELKQIFAFRSSEGDNSMESVFPGLVALRDNAVVLSNHRCASSACVPSRTVLFSGQYGTVTGATQTDGIFKNGADPGFPWMNPDEFPTIGDWMREGGYTTHYFGKWHVSGEATPNLEAYGFSDWELSYPDPHGTLPNNLGHYRDYQFRDLVTSFLRRQGLGGPYNIAHAKHNVALNTGNEEVEEPSRVPKPWFAVASFTNPHDIGAYPGLPRMVSVKPVEGKPYTVAVPEHNQKSTRPRSGSMRLTLNKDNFGQDNARACSTWEEDLRGTKPDCQFDYSYKMGLTLAAKAGYNLVVSGEDYDDSPDAYQANLAKAVDLALDTNKQGLPLTLTGDPKGACDAFMQYYAYLIYEVDKHIHGVLEALEESGQADNTIVIFAPDHGEYGGAHHQMTEKWHSAYEEFTHVPVLIRFPKNGDVDVAGGLREITEPTTHADLLPTVLGLAGFSQSEIEQIESGLRSKHSPNFHTRVYAPVGSDLTPAIKDGAPVTDRRGNPREGVLFMTHDTITEPLARRDDPETWNTRNTKFTNYDVFCATVEALKERTAQDGNPYRYPLEAKELRSGPVCGPNLVHSVVDREGWKLVRYFSDAGKFDSNRSGGPSGFDTTDQFELYDLNEDPQELHNLLKYDALYGTLSDSVGDLPYCDQTYLGTVQGKIESLKNLLKSLEAEMLVTQTTD